MLRVVKLIIVLSLMDANGSPINSVKKLNDVAVEYVTDWELKGRILFAKQLESNTEEFDVATRRLTTRERVKNEWFWDYMDDFSDYKTPEFDPEDSMVLVASKGVTRRQKATTESYHPVMRRSKVMDGDLTEGFGPLGLDQGFNDSFSINNQDFDRQFLPFPKPAKERHNVQIWRQSDSLDSVDKNEINYPTEFDRLPNIKNDRDISIFNQQLFQTVTTRSDLNGDEDDGTFDSSNFPENFNKQRVLNSDRYNQYKPLKDLEDNISKFFATVKKPILTIDYPNRKWNFAQ